MCSIAAFAIVILPRLGVETACTPVDLTTERRAGLRLDGFLDLAGLEAARADVGPGGLPVDDGPDVLQVRVEAPLRGDHGVAPVVPEARLLPANGANLGHRRRSVAATKRPSPRRAAG